MYPFVRMFKEMWRARRMGPLGLFEPHVSHHICWPWDLDLWMELNNGRTLTLFDLGRLPVAERTGLVRVIRAQGWGLTVAGSSVRYRRRVTMFSKLTMHSRCVGWDNRFLYVEQSMWRGGECTSHALLRMALVGKGGMVPPARVAEALGAAPDGPDLPAWVKAWSEADALRPWPPAR
jgi:acyl-CoA thioesterase FadM